MGLDASIPLGVRQVQLAGPMEMQQQALQLRDLMQRGQLGQQQLQQGEMQLQQGRQGMERQNRLRDLLGGLPAGADHDARINALRGGGYFDEADKLETGVLNRRKTEADIGKTTADAQGKGFETLKKRLEAATNVVGSVLGRGGQPTHDDVYGAIDQAARLYGLSAEEQSQMVRGLPGDPSQLRPWLVSKGMELMSAQERFAATTPKLDTMDLGGTREVVDMNPLTRGPAPSSFRKSATPDALVQAQTTRRGQDMTDARSVDANNIQRAATRTQVLDDPERGTFLVDKGTGQSRPVVGADGQPVPSQSRVAATKRAGQLGEGIAEARRLLGNNPTGSAVGAGADMALGWVGGSTQGGRDAASLETLAGWLTANVPRMEGPQSNADVVQYQQMAARVGDRSQPVAARLQALDTLEALQAKYSGLGGGSAPPPAAPAAPPAAAPGARPPLDAFNRK